MATEFNDASHYGFFMTGTTLTSGTGKYIRVSELALAALRSQGVFDNLVDGTSPPAITNLWLDKNSDPAVLKEWDATGSAWVPMTFERLFGRAIVTVMAAPSGTADALVVSEPAPFIPHRTYSITPAFDNTGAAATLQVTGVGTYPIKYTDGSDLNAQELKAGSPTILLFTGTRFEVVFSVAGVYAAADAAQDAADRAEAAQAGVYTVSEGGNTGVDASAVIQALVNSVPEGGTIKFPSGKTWTLSNTIIVAKGVTIDWGGAKFHITANVPAFVFDAGYGEIVALSGDYTAGSTALSVNTMGTVLGAGEVFKLVSNAIDGADRDSGSSSNQYRVGEWAAAKTGTTSTTIQLQQPLRQVQGVSPTSTAGDEAVVSAWTTAMNARVVRLNDKKLVLRGDVEFRYESGHEANWTADCIRIVGYVRPRISDLAILKGYGGGLSLEGCVRASVVRPRMANLTDNTAQGQYGYGVKDSSYATVVEYGWFYGCRHAYTSSNAQTPANDTNASRLLRSGRTPGALVLGCVAYGCGDSLVAPFDTHHSSDDVTFSDCKVYYSGGSAFNVRGRNIRLVNPVARGCNSGINVLTEYQSGDPDDDLWLARKDAEYWTSCQVVGADIECTTQALYSTASTVSLSGNTRLRQTNHTFLTVIGGTVTLSGRHDWRVTDFKGERAITVETAKGAVHAVNGSAESDAAVGATTVIFDNGSDTYIYAYPATDPANQLRLFYAQSTSSVVFRGRINARLSSAFYQLFSSTGTFVSTPGSDLVWEKAGGADNSITLNEGSNKVRFRAEDNTCWYDNTGDVEQVERFSSRNADVNVTHSGTGALVENVWTPPMPQIKRMDAAGHFMKFVVKATKGGSAGAATIRVRLATAFVADIPLLAADRAVDIVFEVYCQGDNDQRCTVISEINDGGGSASIVRKWFTDETVDLAAASFGASFGVNAAVGDTIKFEAYRLRATVAGYGV